MFERYYSIFCYCLLSFCYVVFQKRIRSKPKLGAQAVVRGARPPPPSSDGTVLAFEAGHLIISSVLIRVLPRQRN